MPASQAGRRGFDPRPPLHLFSSLGNPLKELTPIYSIYITRRQTRRCQPLPCVWITPARDHDCNDVKSMAQRYMPEFPFGFVGAMLLTAAVAAVAFWLVRSMGKISLLFWWSTRSWTPTRCKLYAGARSGGADGERRGARAPGVWTVHIADAAEGFLSAKRASECWHAR